MSYKSTQYSALKTIEQIINRPLTEEEKEAFEKLVAKIWEASATYDPFWDAD